MYYKLPVYMLFTVVSTFRPYLALSIKNLNVNIGKKTLQIMKAKKIAGNTLNIGN